MGPPSYMQSVVDRNVLMRRIPVCHWRHTDVSDSSRLLLCITVMNLLSPYALLVVNGRAQIRWQVEVKICERTPVCASGDNLHTTAAGMAWDCRRQDNTCKQKIAMQDTLVSTLTAPQPQRVFFQSLISAGQLSREVLYIRCPTSPHFPFNSVWIIREIQNRWPTIPAGLALAESVSRQTTKLFARNTGNISFEYCPQLKRMWIFHKHSVFQCPLQIWSYGRYLKTYITFV